MLQESDLLQLRGNILKKSFCAVLLLAVGGTPVLADAARAQSTTRAEALLQQMTLEEKIGQLVQRAGGRSKALNSRLDDAELERVRAGQVGSYLHVAGAEPLAKLQKVAVEESRLGVPLLFAMDVVHGYRTIFPVPVGIFRNIDAPTYEQVVAQQVEDARARKPGDLAALVHGGDTWEVR